MKLFMVGMRNFPILYSEPHTHQFFEIVVNLEGEGVEEIGGKKYPFSEGTITIIPPNVEHSKSSAKGFRDAFFVVELSNVFSTTAERFVDTPEKTLKKVVELMYSRYMKMNKNDVVLQNLLELAMSVIYELRNSSSTDYVVEEVKTTLLHCFNDPDLKVDEILKNTGYNVDYVRRRFLAVEKTSPIDYLTEVRIAYAKKILKISKRMSWSIADVSAMCGYYDARYFARVFKKNVGKTPTEYLLSVENS